MGLNNHPIENIFIVNKLTVNFNLSGNIIYLYLE